MDQARTLKAREKTWEVSALSETGYVREENQDRMSGIRTEQGQLYIVADGMGGHKGGATAAELTVQGLQRHLSELLRDVPVEKALRVAFEKTNRTVYEKAHSGDSETEGMGSTAVLLWTSESVVRVAHVGDSRAYLYHQGQLRRLTTDHSKVQKMIDAGLLTPEEARHHPEASVLDRAIGHQPSIEVEISSEVSVSDGDAVLLCSDGLCGYVDDIDIEAVLRGNSTVQQIPERLVDLALEKGGHDNVTVQFIQYGKRKEAQPREKKRDTKELPAALLTGDESGQAGTERRRFIPYQIAAAAIIGALLSAAGSYVYLQQEKIAASDDKADLEARLVIAEEKKTVAEARAQKVEARAKKAEASADQLSGQNNDLSEEVKRIQEKLEMTEQNVEVLEQEKAEATAKADKLGESLQVAETRAQEAEASVHELRRQTNDLKEEVKRIQEKLEMTEQNVEVLEQEKAEATAKADKLEKALQ